MSVLSVDENGWILSHLQFIHNLYTNVMYNHNICKLEFSKDIFNINSSYLRMNQLCKTVTGISPKTNDKRSRKRKRINSISSDKTQKILYIEEAFNKLIVHALEKGFYSNLVSIDYNQHARSASQKFYDNDSDILVELSGGNDSNTAIISKIGNDLYVIPSNCMFYSYDIKKIHEMLRLNNQFDLILMDPPWWNKFIRRNKSFSYKMMNNNELCKIPINKLLSKNGIVAIWCTNASTHLNDIIEVMFPEWGIKFVAKWYWVKVTQSGNPICDFNYRDGKQPYEVLILGTSIINENVEIPDNKLLVSIPSAIHSHKPPIIEILKPYLVNNPVCLEIFARYLLPGWTSWGLEVLKFQRLSLYNVCNINNTNNEKVSQ